ncbi:glycosyltransferase family 4 protein [Fervidobacterium sp.]
MQNTRKKIAVIGSDAKMLVNFRGILIKEFVNCGFEVYALASNFDASTSKRITELGAYPVNYNLSRASLNPIHDIAVFLRLTQLLRKIKPDIVFSYTIKPVIYGTLAASILGIPKRYALITGLGYAFNESQGNDQLKRKIARVFATFLYRLALRRASKVFFQNKDDLSEFVNAGIVKSDKAVLVGATGVDLEHFRASLPPLQPVTFILVARLLKEKGVPEFVDAARFLRSKYRDVRFLLVGGLDPNPDSISKEEVEGWVKDGIIEWVGQVNDVRPYISQASVFVLPSYYREGIPRSTQEAMAMARPVITTDTPGCRETVIDGVNGFLVPPRNVEALVSAMEKFILQPELIVKMGTESRKIAEERFDVHKINKKLLEEMGL